MVAQLSALANEVTRECGRLVLTDNVNLIAMNLTNQVRSIAEVTEAAAGGDLMKTISLGEQALISDVEGTWGELTAVVNKLTANLTSQVRSIAKVTKVVALEGSQGYCEWNGGKITSAGGRSHSSYFRSRKSSQTRRSSTCTGRGRSVVEFGSERSIECLPRLWIKHGQLQLTTAVARDDLTQKIKISVEGEMSTLKGTVNSMVDQLSAFAFEVMRVALEIGTHGILGGQAGVEGERQRMSLHSIFSFPFYDDLRQKMASNLADQEALVNVDVQEKILDLKTTVNSMAAQLSTLANKVTQVSLELRREGILGGQAFILTDNVNLMAMNLNNQVRSIAEVTKAVAGGDLTKTMSMETSWN
ncbi:hypothetical protein BYT27DRAFT_7253585 [Phlegmacium glaucopus]|nr:hypothetical protein BYT27DRAFT_7253585 [Phlegmacium glaucopus]